MLRGCCGRKRVGLGLWGGARSCGIARDGRAGFLVVGMRVCSVLVLLWIILVFLVREGVLGIRT